MTDIINLHGVKKVFTIGVVAATILWSIGIAAVVPLSVEGAAASGDLVKMNGVSAVYYLGADNKRYVFPNQETYFTWYADFKGVKTLPSAELQAIDLSGKNVTVRPGARLAKITTNPKTYAVSPNGTLHWVKTEALAVALYGDDWAKNVMDLDDSAFADYTVGSDINAASDFTLACKLSQSGNLHVTAAFAGPLCPPSTINEDKKIGASTVIPPVTPVVNDPVTVVLASDNPASTSVVTNQQAELARFEFKGKGDVVGVTFEGIGLAAAASFGNMFLFDGDTRLTDSASATSSRLITYSSVGALFSAPKVISVRANLAASSGETIGVKLISFTVAGGTAQTVNVTGNLMSVATATLATVAMTSATGSGNTDPGEGINVWQGTATVGSRDVLLTRLALRQIGSIKATDIGNFKLYVDGAQKGTAVAKLDANNYVTFALSETLLTGARTLKVTADVTGGSNFTVQVSLRGAYDLNASDSQYKASIVPTGTFPFGPSSFTVNAGTVTMVKATDSPTTNLTIGASDQVLGKFKLTAYGETVKVETLKVGMLGTMASGSITDVTLRNVRIMKDGSQVGSTTNVPFASSWSANTGTQFTTNFNVVPGTPVYLEVRGDLVDSEDNGADNDDIASAVLTAAYPAIVGGSASSNGIPQVSLTPINVPTQTTVTSDSRTISSASWSVAQKSNYGAQTIVAPQTDYKIGHYVITNSSSAEDINLTTLYIAFNDTETASTDLSDLYLLFGDGTRSATKGTVTDSTAPSSANSWSVNKTVAANGTFEVEVHATIASTLSTNNIITTFAAQGTTAKSALARVLDTNTDGTLDATGFTGQTITGGTGSITAALDGSTPASAILDDTGTVTTAVYKVSASYDSYTITDLRLTLSNATAVSTVNLVDSTNAPITGGSRPAAETIDFTGLSIAVAANSYTIIKVQAVLAGVGPGAGTSGSAITTALVGASSNVRNSGGTTSTLTASGTLSANAMYVYKAIPTITTVALPSTSLVAGGSVQTLAKFTVASSGGPIGWQQIIFNISKNVGGADTLATPTLWDVTGGSGGTQVAGTGSFTGTVNVDDDTAGGIVFNANAEQVVNGSKTYELRATVGGTPATGNALTTNIASVATYTGNTYAYSYNAGSGSNKHVADLDNSLTITANDVRQTAQSQFTAAATTATGSVVGVDASNKITASFGMPDTIVLTMAEGSTAETLGAATFTVTGAGSAVFNATAGAACTPYTGQAYSGAVSANSTLWTAIRSIRCTNTAGTIDVKITNGSAFFTNDTGGDVDASNAVITITKGTDYAIGSVVVGTDSDATLTLTTGVTGTATFVWSDMNAASHARTTTDWVGDTLIQTLASATQSLTR